MKIEMYVGLVTGRTCREVAEIDDADLEGLSDDEREEYLTEYTRQWMWELVTWGYEVVK
jgi:hypothetical protein